MEMRNNTKTRRGRTKEQQYWLTRWVTGVTKKSTEAENKLDWENWQWLIPRKTGGFSVHEKKEVKNSGSDQKINKQFEHAAFPQTWEVFLDPIYTNGLEAKRDSN